MSAVTARLLRDARGLIAEHWGQGSGSAGETPKGCYCAVDAIEAIAEKLDLPYAPAEFALCRAIGEAAVHEDEATAIIVCWNDRRDRSQAEVLAAFDRAIAAEEVPP